LGARFTCVLLIATTAAISWAQPQPSTRPSAATLRIDASARAAHAIPVYITGKFCEHLGSNIYNGMCAQILRNPTFAEHPFWNGAMTPDGRTAFLSDEDKIAEQIRSQANRLNWPSADIARLVEARSDGLAFWWIRQGRRDAVLVSPDAGPHGGRAQRIEVRAAGDGIAQWTYLPLHRVKRYEYEVLLRSPDVGSLSVTLAAHGAATPAAQSKIDGVARKWKSFRGTLELSESAPPESLYRFAMTANASGQLVIARVQLWPADHVNGADPDVVRLLKESHLPLLRWPGGNFVSAYHFEDGIGPVDQRPARANFAWGGTEPNLFGTDEFIAFCRAVGAEPMICINAGDGTPDEAARWIEYCNGPAASPMGAKRAANGHPQPYNVKLWEVGNELWGRWQCGWTTPAGNADRYREYSEAMLKADPRIRLYACGAPVLWGHDWNKALFARAGATAQATTDHPLIGGNVSASVDPLDVYRDFMAVPGILERRWGELQKSMLQAGIAEPRLAISELQLFAHIAPPKEGQEQRLRRDNLVTPGTQAEALYDTLMYHVAVRLAPFVELVTHSATVNHGGGLSKQRERVFAQPCYYAQAAFSAFAGAAPVAAELNCPNEKAPFVLPDIASAGPDFSYPRVGALAAIAKDRSLLISLVHRGTQSPIDLNISLGSFKPGGAAEIWSLSATAPWLANTLQSPTAVAPTTSTETPVQNAFWVTLRPYTVLRIRIPAAP